MELTIGKQDIITDFAELVYNLHVKFNFKDKKAFELALLDLIETIPINKPFESDKIFNKFMHLIAEHSSNPSILYHSEKAREEVSALVRE